MEVRALSESATMFAPMIDALWGEWESEFVKIGYESREAVSNFYATVVDRFYFIQDDGRFVGCYSIHGNTIGDVLVVAARRGEGLGRMLMRDALRRCWYRPRMLLYCRENLVPFYEKFGFASSDETPCGKKLMIRYSLRRLDLYACAAIVTAALLWASKTT